MNETAKKIIKLTAITTLLSVIAIAAWFAFFREKPDKKKIADELREAIFSEPAKKAMTSFKQSLFEETEVAPEIQFRPKDTPPDELKKEPAPKKEIAVREVSVEEIFKISNPPRWLDHLSSAQDYLINVGEIDTDKRSKLNSDEEISAFLIESLDYLVKNNTISDEDKKRYSKFLAAEYVSLKKEEGDLIRQTLKLQGLFNINKPRPEKKHVNKHRWPLTQQVGFSWTQLQKTGLLGFIKNGLELISKQHAAYAQSIFGINLEEISSDICYRAPEAPLEYLYQQPTDRGQDFGITLWSPCCNCSTACGKDECPIGCLNNVCEQSGAIIWDSASGTCGCGGDKIEGQQYTDNDGEESNTFTH